jgi:hypothetical protein
MQVSRRYCPGFSPVRYGILGSIILKGIAMTTPKRFRAIKDRRSIWYRRHCELSAAFLADLGDNPSAADRSFADHAATVAIACEMLKVRQLNGEPIDVDDVVRLGNHLTRIRIEFSKRAVASAPTAKQQSDEWIRMQEEGLAQLQAEARARGATTPFEDRSAA